MSETTINLENITFDEHGKVKISSVELSNKLSELFDLGDSISSSCNNGCGNTSNTGCGNNGSCAESSTIFKSSEVNIDEGLVTVDKYDFNKIILKAKLNGDSELNLKVSSF